MAQIRPFSGIQYARDRGFDFSSLIAPPYDVLDEAGKAALQKKHPNNIVTVDLPHMPPKTVGPDEMYAKAADTLKQWMSSGVLHRDLKSAFYAYAQNYAHAGRTFHRRGMIAVVKLSPFGQGHVVPHEKTYPEAIADRLKLTRATKIQLSPIFGLYSDPRNEITGALFKNVGKPEISATLGDVRNDLWSVHDAQVQNTIVDLMGARPIYIADGHHRYTMALQYQKEMAEKNGGSLPPNHPANYCMFVLVAMQDDGLLILPTHRLIGNIPDFNIEAFKKAVAPVADVTDLAISESDLPRYIDKTLPAQPPHTFGLFDGATRKAYQITIRIPDVLGALEAGQSPSWRKLDVAVLQRYFLDEILKPKFAAGSEPTRGYTADSSAVTGMTDGKKYRIALLLKSTPLTALQELGKTGEVMPQKSTFFYPKLATGMVMHGLE